MARKRIAGSELNHENWDEYEPEEAGTFKKASSSILEGRVIKTAKRRNPISSGNTETNTKNVFSNFGGFNRPATTQSPSPSPSPFAFLSKFTETQSKSNGVSTTNTTSSADAQPATNSIFKSGGSAMSTSEPTPKTEKSAEYYSKLKGLNESVSSWIKMHVDKNPMCILTPIFDDYKKYLEEMDKEEKKEVSSSNSASSLFATKAFPSDAKATQATISTLPAFGSVNKSSESSKVDGEESAQSSMTASVVTAKPTFSFGTLPTATTSTTGFSFGSGQPFTFSNVSKPEITENSSANDAEEEDEPPKVEFKPVVEDGSIFSQRCKVFVKKDGTFGDRGVGQLFLKPVAGSEKIQLIVRADTNLGNLLLNFILSESTPMQRMGKNHVMLVSIPTPDAKPPPTPILLKVKTAEEADELLKVLEKHKK